MYGSQAIPKQVFGEGTKLLDTFYNSMNTLAPRAWELNKTFLDIWRNDVDAYSWVLPDNFHVHVKVMKPMKDTVHFLNGNYDVVYKEQAPTEHGRSVGAK